MSEQIIGDKAQGNVQAWRYFGIGDGVSLDRYIIEGKDNKAMLDILQLGGTTVTEYVQRRSTRFWMWSSYIEGHNRDLDFPAEPGDNMTPQVPEIPPNGKDAIFEDSEENCAASFATIGSPFKYRKTQTRFTAL